MSFKGTPKIGKRGRSNETTPLTPISSASTASAQSSSPGKARKQPPVELTVLLMNGFAIAIVAMNAYYQYVNSIYIFIIIFSYYVSIL